jgi:hypothetical protein
MYPHIACVATKPSQQTLARRRRPDPILHVSEPPDVDPFRWVVERQRSVRVEDSFEIRRDIAGQGGATQDR